MSGMTQQPGPEETVARLAQEIVALSWRLQQVGRELQAVQAVTRGHPQPRPVAPQGAPGMPGARSPWAPPVGPTPPPPGPMGPPPRQQPPAAPRLSWWQREGATSRVLAVAGSVITLLGVVLLLVLAVQNGHLGPVPRVIGGAVLAAGLIGVGVLLRKRQGKNIGAVALVATGTAGLYLDVVAATAFYGWLPVWAGLLLGLAIAAAGLVLAHRWDSEALAVLAVLGAAVLSPALTEKPDALLTSFLLVLSVAGGALQPRHAWKGLFAVRAVVPVIAAALSLVAVQRSDTSELWFTVLTCVLVTLAGIGFSLLAVHRDRSDVLALSMLSLSVAPTLLSAAVLDRWPGTAVIAGLAVLLLALRFGLRWLPRNAQVVLTVLGAGATIEAICIAATLSSRPSLALALAAVYGGLGALLLLGAAPPGEATVSSLAESYASWPKVVACLLLAVAAAALAYEAHWAGLQTAATISWVIGGAAMLYGVTTAFVFAGVLLPLPHGFVAGHTTATITWMVAALVLLGKGLGSGRLTRVARVSGLVLAGAAVAKLLLFDLAALDGILRVIGFIVVGLLLIAAGTRYAKALSQQQGQAAAPSQGPPRQGPPQQGPPMYG